MPQEPTGPGPRLEGAAAWASYGALEALFAIVVRRTMFGSAFVPPDDRFTLALLVLYPLIGALLGRYAVAGLAVAFAANALAVMSGAALAVPLVSAGLAMVLYRKPWAAALALILPIWASREIGYVYTFGVKALLAAGAILVVLLLAYLSTRVRRPVAPAATLAIFAITMLACTMVEVKPPRDLDPEQPPPGVSSPNIVLIVMDTVRADHLSVYGYGRRTTPNLERFARQATVYARAYAPSNMTLPTHASVFTGLYGSEHTAHYDEGWAVGRPLPAGVLTIAELLAARGYATASIAANYVYLSDEFGLGQGFQHLDARPPRMPFGAAWNFYLRSRLAAVAGKVLRLPRRTHLLSRPAEEISDLAIAYLERVSGKRRPFFLTLNYMDAHAPCIPPPPFDSMFPGRDPAQPVDLADRMTAGISSGTLKLTEAQRAHLVSQYDGAIAHSDSQIARVIDALRRGGVLDRTMVVILSDHGEQLGEKGVIGHGYSNYESEVRVPLIVKKPGQTAGEVVGQPVSLLDLWPMISASAPQTYRVIAEAFPLRGEGARMRYRRPGTAKIEAGIKTIVNVGGRIESYDLIADPSETRDLAPSADSRRMAAEIAAWRRGLSARPAAQPATPIDPETLRRLRALGYLQ